MNPHRRPKSSRWENPISRLQAARYELKMSQEDVCARVRETCPGQREGQPCRIDSSKLSEYENDTRTPGRKHVIALSRVYGKTPEELGLLPQSGTAPADDDAGTPGTVASGTVAVIDPQDSSGTNGTSRGYATPDEGTQFPGTQMRRDTFMKGIGAAAGAAAIDPFVLLSQQARERINHTKITNEQIERLRIATYDYARSGYQTAGAHEARLRGLTSDWAMTQRLLGVPQTLSQRNELTDVFARLSAVLSLSLFGLGQYKQAQALRDAAKDAAREAGDADLVSWIYDRECDATDDVATSPYELHEVSLAGLDTLGSSQTLTAAKLHCWAARGYAGVGDELTAFAHLETAERLLGKNVAGCWPRDHRMPRGYTFAEDGFAGAMSEVNLVLGKYREAIEYCERQAALHREFGLPLRTAHIVTKNRLRHATALLRTGEIEGATRAAATAVSNYEGSARHTVMRTARDFERDLKAADTSRTYAGEFSEFLRGQVV